jgi:site-specific recombinase XerD
MITLQLRAIIHRDTLCIAIYFDRLPALQTAIRKITGVKWSQTYRCWWLPLTKDNYTRIIRAVQGIAWVDETGLRDFLWQRAAVIANSSYSVAHTVSNNDRWEKHPGGKQSNTIHPANKQELQKMRQHLVLKAYSATTIKTYTNELSAFFQAIKQHPAAGFTTERIRDYLQYCAEKLKLSENTLHSRINALKFYYEQVLDREKFFWEIPRPKRPQQLPRLLNEKEIAGLFNALSNKKHKAILFTAYSAGLRVSEVVNLKLADIDSGRMQILVKNAKGKKDRYVNLSPVLLDILRQYLKSCKNRPKVYLFESDQTHSAYPTRTIQEIFSKAKHKAGIKKGVGIHSLRHSFATHLLDKGTDIRYIKDLLGHFNIKTTERYLHVSRKQLVNIISPFDDLWKKENIEW